MSTAQPMLSPTAGTRSTRVASIRSGPLFIRHDDLADDTVTTGGPFDLLTIDEVIDRLPTLPNWPQRQHDRARRSDATARILRWLAEQRPEAGWQGRWTAANVDDQPDGLDVLPATDGVTRTRGRRTVFLGAVNSILLCGIVRPGYRFLHHHSGWSVYDHVHRLSRPDLFDVIEARVMERDICKVYRRDALAAIGRLVLHTGRPIDQLTDTDLLSYRACYLRFDQRGTLPAGLPLAWELLHGIADLGEHAVMKNALRVGQRPTADLVDAYGVRSDNVREVLIRYLDERRPSLDYGTFVQLVGRLIGLFWCDIERHHPGIDSLDLSADVAEGWKQRVRVVIGKEGNRRPRKGSLDELMCVRAFYRDLQEWSMQDPSWSRWCYPNPIRKRDADGQSKIRRTTTAEMHQRVRDRLPHLPVLVDTANRHRLESAALLAAARSTAVEDLFEHGERQYQRVAPQSALPTTERGQRTTVWAQDVVSGEIVDAGKRESEGFWAWAVLETLRHTGVRVEELLELTHLGLVSYRLPDTGEVVPMLQIVPSKSNEERLLLVSPELANVLAAIITRLRTENGGVVPVSARYDPHERTPGPALPHLFQHRLGWKWTVPASTTVQKWLTQTVERSGLIDAVGKPLRYTPHDFRRLFATDAVTGGLPVHIVARLLGHKNLQTTQAYMAVFDEELVRSYRSFLDTRRSLRPVAEYREPTDAEWREFQQHFELRKLELGTCGRPYGTPCKHEHACVRCPSLRVDPAAKPRLVEIVANLRDRIQEARTNGWTGEVEGLKISLEAAAAKIVAVDRISKSVEPRNRKLTELGIPVVNR